MDDHNESRRAGADAVEEAPVLEFPDHAPENVEHPFDAAERVLAAAS